MRQERARHQQEDTSPRAATGETPPGQTTTNPRKLTTRYHRRPPEDPKEEKKSLRSTDPQAPRSPKSHHHTAKRHATLEMKLREGIWQLTRRRPEELTKDKGKMLRAEIPQQPETETRQERRPFSSPTTPPWMLQICNRNRRIWNRSRPQRRSTLAEEWKGTERTKEEERRGGN